MKRRRGRRGFWWWSWLLALVTIGGVVGGFFFGKKQWEDAPKDYVSAATVSFHVRPPFVASGAGVQQTVSGIANLNEVAVMREIESDSVLSPLVTELDLSQKWGLGTDDAVAELREAIELDLNREKKELYVILTRPDPVESALIANGLADRIAPTIKAFDDQAKAEGVNKVDDELRPFLEAEADARATLKAALMAKDIKIDPEPGVDLGPYLFIPEVLAANLEWDSARENLETRRAEQGQYSSYWGRAVKPSIVMVRAEPPPTFSGPELKPFQVEWALYGLTTGLVVGSLLSLLCWKLFP